MRSLWQVLGAYAAASWFCLQIIDVLTQNIGLPPWVFTLTLGILVAGLPLTAATAYFQGIGRRTDVEATANKGPFTWNNLLKGAVAALAIWGIAVTGWLIQSDQNSAETERNLVTSLNEIERLVGEFNFSAAYAIAEQLDGKITDDLVRKNMWSKVADEMRLETDPPGATVLRRDYYSTESEWVEIGTTPLDVKRFPLGLSRFLHYSTSHANLLHRIIFIAKNIGKTDFLTLLLLITD